MKAVADVEALRANLSSLIAEAGALRQDVRSAEQARRRENLISLLLSFVGVAVIGLVLVVAWQGQTVSRQNNRIIHQIDSCITPGGTCYQEQQQRTGQIVRQIVTAQTYVAECARSADSDAELEQCVADKLADAPRN